MDDEDRLKQMIMPSGRAVTYSKDNVRWNAIMFVDSLGLEIVRI